MVTASVDAGASAAGSSAAGAAVASAAGSAAAVGSAAGAAAPPHAAKSMLLTITRAIASALKRKRIEHSSSKIEIYASRCACIVGANR
jgi:hypothetical protein